VYSLPEADIVLAVNMGSGMYHDDDPARVTGLDVERNLAAFVSFIEYALEQGKTVAVGDVACCNGSDGELLRILHGEDLLMRLAAYAGWNTSSNTLGTALSAAVHFLLGKDGEGRKNFLLHRYYEDMGYMAHTRAFVTENKLPAMGLDYFHADGERGEVARFVKEELTAFMRENFPGLAVLVENIEISMPWRRMFETDVAVIMKKGEQSEEDRS